MFQIIFFSLGLKEGEQSGREVDGLVLLLKTNDASLVTLQSH